MYHFLLNSNIHLCLPSLDIEPAARKRRERGMGSGVICTEKSCSQSVSTCLSGREAGGGITVFHHQFTGCVSDSKDAK